MARAGNGNLGQCPDLTAMRPLVHPAADTITVEGILHALADPVRVRILAGLMVAECPRTCSAFVDVSERTIPKSTLSAHFKVLREAGLIRSERKGVEMHNVPRVAEVSERFGPLIDAIMAAHAAEQGRQCLAGEASPA